MLNPIKYLEFRAKMEPEKLALCDLSRSSNYGQLFLLVKKIAKKLEVAGIKPGDLVLTRLPNILDWVFTNALFHEACVSCSSHSDDPIDPRLQVDWVISLVPLANFAEDKVLVVDRAWLQDVENGEPSSVIKTFASEDDLCRLIFTGGTTGGAKAVPYSLRLLAERLPTTNPSWSADRDEMALMGLDSVVGFLTALKSSVLGKTFYCPPPDDVVKCANHFKITSLIGSPIQLAGFVKRVELSADGIPPVQEIRVAGGVLPQPLMHQLWRLFHAKIYNDYGSTEVGG